MSPSRYSGRPSSAPPASSRFDRIVGLACVPHFQLVAVDDVVPGARELGGPDWPPGSVISTGPNEPKLRVVRELDTENDDSEMPEGRHVTYTGRDEPNLRTVRILDTENDDPEMHFTVLVVEPT
jgi:hypothetical protein